MELTRSLQFICFFAVAISTSCKSPDFILNEEQLDKTAIVLPDDPSSIVRFAAKELNLHLNLIYNRELPVIKNSAAPQYDQVIYIGIKPDGFSRKLQPEEAVYLTNRKALYFFGDDQIRMESKDEEFGKFGDPVLNEVLNMSFNKTGTLFALYNFLEKEMSVTWIKPGNEGIFIDEISSDKRLTFKENSWTPSFVQRNFRAGRHAPGPSKYSPPEFALSEEESLKKNSDEYIWLRRMRFGYSVYYRFGHAFTNYWDNYKDTNPDIFALTIEGDRKPMKLKERIKMCPSNPELVEIVIREWLERRKKSPWDNSFSIPGPENDSQGLGDAEWCHCDSCRALDTQLQGEALSDHLTDRYVYFWNKVVQEARKYQEDVMVTGYAYEQMLLPPRKIHLHKGLLIEFIPRMAGDLEKTRDLFNGWKEMGMENMFFRPNDLNWELGITMGWEERLFRHLKLAIKNGAKGTDFDSMYGHWEGVSDIAYFILAMAHVYPDASFEELENKFLSVFGEASEDIRAYYKHWRNIFNNKLIPADLALSDGIEPVYFEWHDLGKLTQRIDEFYSKEDFDMTDKYLEKALTRDITEKCRKYIKKMKIANKHNRLTFEALVAGMGEDKNIMIEKTKNLIDFRIENRDRLDLNWNILFWSQYYHMYDQLGTNNFDYMK